MVQQVLGVGPVDALKVLPLVEQSKKAAQESGLPGLHNGEADALRHCYWSCEMTQAIGSEQAKRVGDVHEACGKGPPQETNMDLKNNAVGRTLGNSSQADCRNECAAAVKDRRLTILHSF